MHLAVRYAMFKELIITSMKAIKIEKPILEKRTGIGKAFDEMFKQSFPIHYWCQKNKKK